MKWIKKHKIFSIFCLIMFIIFLALCSCIRYNNTCIKDISIIIYDDDLESYENYPKISSEMFIRRLLYYHTKQIEIHIESPDLVNKLELMSSNKRYNWLRQLAINFDKIYGNPNELEISITISDEDSLTSNFNGYQAILKKENINGYNTYLPRDGVQSIGNTKKFSFSLFDYILYLFKKPIIMIYA